MVLVLILHVLEGIDGDLAIFRRLLKFIGRKPRLHDVLLNRQQAREGNIELLDILRHLHRHSDAARLDRANGIHIADAGNPKHLGYLRADLCRIAVRRLQAAEDEVELAQAANALRERVARREHIRAAELPIRNERTLVRTH